MQSRAEVVKPACLKHASRFCVQDTSPAADNYFAFQRTEDLFIAFLRCSLYICYYYQLKSHIKYLMELREVKCRSSF